MTWKYDDNDDPVAGVLKVGSQDIEAIRLTLHRRLMSYVNGRIDLTFARELVRLGWTPPPGHPVLDKVGDDTHDAG